MLGWFLLVEFVVALRDDGKMSTDGVEIERIRAGYIDAPSEGNTMFALV